MKRVRINKDIEIMPSVADYDHCYTAYIYDILYKGDVVCQSGIEIRNGFYFMFMDEIKKDVSALEIVRNSKDIMRFFVDNFRSDIYAWVDMSRGRADKFLKLLGFKEFMPNIVIFRRF